MEWDFYDTLAHAGYSARLVEMCEYMATLGRQIAEMPGETSDDDEARRAAWDQGMRAYREMTQGDEDAAS